MIGGIMTFLAGFLVFFSILENCKATFSSVMR